MPSASTTRIAAGAVMAIIGHSIFLAAPIRAQDDMLTAQEPCQLELSVEPAGEWMGPYGRGYDVFEAEQAFEPFAVSVRHAGVRCEFFLTASPSDAGNGNVIEGPVGRISYDLLMSTSGPSFLSESYMGTDTSRIEGTFGTGSGLQTANLLLYFAPGQWIAGGRYDGAATIRLFRSDPDGPELVDEISLPIAVDVPASLRIRSDRFAQGTRETMIDLGNLGEGSSTNIGFNVESNADISVTVDSANRGKLSHMAGAPGIPYRLLFEGTDLDLSGATSIRKSVTGRSKGGQAMSFELDVPAPRQLPASGEYTDTLTITFVAE